MNDYHALMTANRNTIQQLEARATLLASLGFRPTSSFGRLVRHRVVALETDFIVTRPALAAPSRSQAV